ncbi:hypothetical protein Cabys_749 [Caldithrix abyssi DSM 13497]|uniref:Uncharacterized protein n=1 Tax=Caldithrix abyssi DSM 13497 TaxID=880073 RepID=A0A1J1C508_CALAY|nr:hypothetical protein Cabys_749 [Caldithrix abyssi DSM 13497]
MINRHGKASCFILVQNRKGRFLTLFGRRRKKATSGKPSVLGRSH